MAGQARFHPVGVIMRRLKISKEKATLIRRLVKEEDIVGHYQYPHTESYYTILEALKKIGCTRTEAWAGHCLNMPGELERRLACIDEVLGTYGTVAVRDERKWDVYYGDIVMEHCNTGDTYAETICMDTATGRFFISSWGDWAEKHLPSPKE